MTGRGLHLPWPLKRAALAVMGGKTVICPECRQPVARELFATLAGQAEHLVPCRARQAARKSAEADARST
jgi:hypothetical protein